MRQERDSSASGKKALPGLGRRRSPSEHISVLVARRRDRQGRVWDSDGLSVPTLLSWFLGSGHLSPRCLGLSAGASDITVTRSHLPFVWCSSAVIPSGREAGCWQLGSLRVLLK